MKTPPWLKQDLKNDCHALLGEILNRSSSPSQFESICERIRNTDDARKERGELIDKIYELVGAVANKSSTASAIQNVYKAFYRLEITK